MNAARMALLLAEMKSNQWKSRAELEAIQEGKLRDLISYARKHVPHYRDLEEVKSIDGLSELPVLGKPHVVGNPDSFISAEFDKRFLKKQSTSGSTGIPLDIYHHGRESVFGPAFELRHLTEVGVGPLDLQMRIAHYSREPNMLQRLGLFRREYLSIFDKPAENIRMLRSRRPDVLFAFTSVLSSLAHANNASEGGVKAKAVLSCGEVLTEDTRKLISSSFGCPVYDAYGCMETSWIAWECEQGSLHVNSDHLIIEIVDDDDEPVGRGRYGNVLVTPLWQRAMPFIRYRVGDRTAFGPGCRCGRGLPVIKPVEGRDDDFLMLQDGTRISPRVLPCALVEVEGIREYQIIQDDVDDFTFRYVPMKDVDLRQIEGIFRRHLGDVRLGFEKVDEIPSTKTGKRKKVMSKLS